MIKMWQGSTSLPIEEEFKEFIHFNISNDLRVGVIAKSNFKSQSRSHKHVIAFFFLKS